MNFITDTLNYHLFPVARKHHHKNKTYLTKIKSLILNYLMLTKYMYYSSQTSQQVKHILTKKFSGF